ncbi:hypothetical protein Tco_1022775, partial [Tanacetum coccineum]
IAAEKEPLTFDTLMVTPIDFSKFALNGLNIEVLTREIMVGPAYKLLKADYFFNNDLEFLKSTNPEKTYCTSITKTKTARSQNNTFSKHNVYSTLEIMSVVSVKVEKLHGCGYLKEIVVRRSDGEKHAFKDYDFPYLHMNDIKDMLLLAVQHKLFQLDGDVIVDFIAALRMFTKSIIIKIRVEDVQLRVESYQKKLNLTRPQRKYLEIEAKELYTPSFLAGVIYEDQDNQKRIMRADELHKKWSKTDQEMSKFMVELIDQLMHEREIIRNLERLVGARKLEKD